MNGNNSPRIIFKKLVYGLKLLFVVMFSLCFFAIYNMDSIIYKIGSNSYYTYDKDKQPKTTDLTLDDTLARQKDTIKEQVKNLLEQILKPDIITVYTSYESYKNLELNSTPDIDSFDIHLEITTSRLYFDNDLSYDKIQNNIIKTIEQINNSGYQFDSYKFNFVLNKKIFRISNITENTILSNNLKQYIIDNGEFIDEK